MRKFLLSLLLASGMASAESGTLIKNSVLHRQPQSGSDTVTTLSSGTAVTIVSRQGAWIQVKTDAGVSGWARIFDVRTGSGQAGASGLSQFASAFKTGSSGDTVSTGVGGLQDEGDALQKAQANPAEDAKLGKFASNSADASSGARQVKLSAQQVDWLKEDKK